MRGYETVIGLEVHVELDAGSKIFCGCRPQFGAPPNTIVCPVCLGLPGALPVLNRGAAEKGIAAALALGCRVNRVSAFDRKNYFYPDLPKGYQITQFFRPLAEDGSLCCTREDGTVFSVGIERIHLEEDAGKLVYDDEGRTLVDYNRCGVPLIEIVTRPDIRSGQDAACFVSALRRVLKEAGVSPCRMQMGELRVDVNLSVRKKDSQALNTRTEMKNLGSIKAVARAAQYEAERQIGVIEQGGSVLQQTLGWDEELQRNYIMRTKEDAQDYRYFPEPDLGPLVVEKEWIESVKRSLPETAAQRAERLKVQFDLREDTAQMLAEDEECTAYFEQVIASGANARMAANLITGELKRLCRQAGERPGSGRIPAAELAELTRMAGQKIITLSAAKGTVLEEMFASRAGAMEVAGRLGLIKTGQEEPLDDLIYRVLQENGDAVRKYVDGNKKTLGFLMGQLMRLSGGRIDPAEAQQRLIRQINREV